MQAQTPRNARKKWEWINNIKKYLNVKFFVLTENICFVVKLVEKGKTCVAWRLLRWFPHEWWSYRRNVIIKTPNIECHPNDVHGAYFGTLLTMLFQQFIVQLHAQISEKDTNDAKSTCFHEVNVVDDFSYHTLFISRHLSFIWGAHSSTSLTNIAFDKNHQRMRCLRAHFLQKFQNMMFTQRD